MAMKAKNKIDTSLAGQFIKGDFDPEHKKRRAKLKKMATRYTRSQSISKHSIVGDFECQ